MTPLLAIRHHRVLRIVGASLASLIALWVVGWLTAGDSLLVVRFGAYAAPWLAAIAIGTAGLLGAVRDWRWMTLALAAALLISAPILPRFNPLRLWQPEPTGSLRVMTFNTSYSNGNFAAIASLISSERPDIVFLQQLASLSKLQSVLRRTSIGFNYFSAPAHDDDTLILSRFPLSQVREFQQRTTAVAAIGGCRVRLWSLHAPHGQFAIDEQAHYFYEAARDIVVERMPVILGGDLNSTEFDSSQAPLRGELADAFSAAGFGPGFTFPSHARRMGVLGPLVRIDHIFFRGLNAVSARTFRDGAGSDHLPVFAEFRLADSCRLNTGAQ